MIGEAANIRVSADGIRTAGQSRGPAACLRHAAFSEAIGGRWMWSSHPMRRVERVFADAASVQVFNANVALKLALGAPPAADTAAANAAPATAGSPGERSMVVRMLGHRMDRTDTVRTLVSRLVRQFVRVDRLVPAPAPRAVGAAAPELRVTPRNRVRAARQSVDMVVRRLQAPAPAQPRMDLPEPREMPASRFAAPVATVLTPSEINRVTSEVISTLNRQAAARRERMGRV